MLTSTELAWMRSTENQAMASTAIILSPNYEDSALGETVETWLIAGTVNCDIWPFNPEKEKSSGNQEISEGRFYISFPSDTSLTVENKVTVDNVIYDITFSPLQQSWLTNLRCEARNYNGSPLTVTLGTALYQSGMDQLISLLTDIKGLMVTNSVSQFEVNASTSNQLLKAANSNRTGLQIHNNGTANLYINLGTVAATDNYTDRPIEANAYWEMPFPIYTGNIYGVWDAANGYATITEFS